MAVASAEAIQQQQHAQGDDIVNHGGTGPDPPQTIPLSGEDTGWTAMPSAAGGATPVPPSEAEVLRQEAQALEERRREVEAQQQLLVNKASELAEREQQVANAQQHCEAREQQILIDEAKRNAKQNETKKPLQLAQIRSRSVQSTRSRGRS